jgi:hypothetical protein
MKKPQSIIPGKLSIRSAESKPNDSRTALSFAIGLGRDDGSHSVVHELVDERIGVFCHRVAAHTVGRPRLSQVEAAFKSGEPNVEIRSILVVVVLIDLSRALANESCPSFPARTTILPPSANRLLKIKVTRVEYKASNWYLEILILESR